MASCTPWIVVPRSATIWLIDTFITLLSSTITNWAAARMPIGSQAIGAAAAAVAGASRGATVMPGSHAEAGAVERLVVPLLAELALRRLGTAQVARVGLAQDPVEDRPEDRQHQHDQQPGHGVLGVEPALEDVDDAQQPGGRDGGGDDNPDERGHAPIFSVVVRAGNGARWCPVGVCAPAGAARRRRRAPGRRPAGPRVLTRGWHSCPRRMPRKPARLPARRASSTLSP